MKPFLSAGVKSVAIEPAVYYTSRFSNKKIGKFPLASGTMGGTLPSTNYNKMSGQVIRFKDALYMFLSQTLFRLVEGETEWKPIWVSPTQNVSSWVMGPHYFIQNGTPVIAWLDYSSTSLYRLRTYDGQTVRSGPTWSSTVNPIFDSTYKDYRFFNNIVICGDSSSAVVASISASGLSDYAAIQAGGFGHETCSFNNQLYTMYAYAGPTTLMLLHTQNALPFTQAFSDDATPFNTMNYGLFKGANNNSLWGTYLSQASGLRIKNLVPQAEGSNYFNFVNYEGILGLSVPGVAFGSGMHYALHEGAAIDFCSIYTTKKRFNSEDLTKVREDIYFSANNGPITASSYSLDILNPNGSNPLVHHTSMGGFNTANSFPFDKVGEGCREFDGNWAYIQIENFEEGDGYGRSKMSFRLYESQTFPRGTVAQAAFLWTPGDGYPDRYLTVSNPSHGTMNGSYNTGLTFNSGILYTVEVESIPNGLNDNDVMTIVPVASGII